MEKVKILLLGDSPIAQYARYILSDYDVLMIADRVRDPVLPDNFHPQAAFSVKYPYLLKKDFIERVGVPIINFHTAPLPELRGVDTTSWAIIHGLKRFGVTVHLIEEKVDNGAIVLKRTFPVKSYDTAYSLYNKNLALLTEILEENLIDYAEGKYTTKQVKSKVSYVHKNGEFDYTKLDVTDSAEIRARVFPGRQMPYVNHNSVLHQ